MSGRSRAVALVGTGLAGALALAVVSIGPAGGDGGSTVTSGPFSAFGAGTGRDIGGRADMVRRASGSTKVSIHVTGLAPGGTYASHVHKAACADGLADGHYQKVPGGPVTAENEIWPSGGPSFTANEGGIVNENVTVGYTAGSDAVSVVVHDLALPSTGNKVACADLAAAK